MAEVPQDVLRSATDKNCGREEFESSSLGEPARTGGKFQGSSGEGDETCDVVVPYCTVGYRSGQYAKKLMDLG